jgi:hypothetical protein
MKIKIMELNPAIRSLFFKKKKKDAATIGAKKIYK